MGQRQQASNIDQCAVYRPPWRGAQPRRRLSSQKNHTGHNCLKQQRQSPAGPQPSAMDPTMRVDDCSESVVRPHWYSTHSEQPSFFATSKPGTASESDSRSVNVIGVLQRSGQRKSCVSIGRNDQDNTVCGNTFADFQKSIFARNPKAVRSSDGTYLSSLFRATQSLSRAESLYFSGRIFKAATTFSNE